MYKTLLIALALTGCAHDNSEPETRAETITWTAPTENTDGSLLTDLAGYYLFYGTATEPFMKKIGPYQTSYTVYISNEYHRITMIAFNALGTESDPSNVVWK